MSRFKDLLADKCDLSLFLSISDGANYQKPHDPKITLRRREGILKKWKWAL